MRCSTRELYPSRRQECLDAIVTGPTVYECAVVTVAGELPERLGAARCPKSQKPVEHLFPRIRMGDRCIGNDAVHVEYSGLEMQLQNSISLARAAALYGGADAGACRWAAIREWGELAICWFHLIVRRKIGDAPITGLGEA